MRARIIGGVQYVCPKCGNMERASGVNWRIARRPCNGCHMMVAFGVGLVEVGGPPAPFNALYMGRMMPWGTNRVRPHDGQAWVGQIAGTIVWTCPCGRNRPRRDGLVKDRQVDCNQCGMTWEVVLLLYNPPQGKRVGIPPDWVLPGEWEQNDNIDNAGVTGSYIKRTIRTRRNATTGAGVAAPVGTESAPGTPATGERLLGDHD